MKIKFLVFIILISVSLGYCNKSGGNATGVVSGNQDNQSQRKKKKVYTDDTLIVNAVNECLIFKKN